MSLSNSINASFESIENALKLNDTIQQSADSLVLLKAKLTSDPKCSPQVYKQIEDVVGQLEVVKVAAQEATDRMDKALEATISAREKTVANSKAKTSKPASKGSQTTSKSNSGGGALPKVKIGCGRPNCKLLHKYQAKQAARNAAQPNSLPDKVLERIFATLDTGTLMSCRWVTKRWRTLVQKVLCEKGKVLKLAIICKDASKEFIRSRTQDTKKYGGGFLRTDSTASRNFHYLKKSFPDVTKLDILFISPLDLQPLLRNWSSMLTTLTLRQIPAAIFDKLTRTLANIATLRELHLLHLGETTIPECTTILRQLECFTLLGYRGPIQAVLRSLGDKLTHLTLDHVVCTSFDLFKLVADTDITLCPSVTHLTLGELFVPVGDEKWATTNYLEILTLIGYSMSSLKHFELHFASEVKLVDLVARLGLENGTYYPSLTSLCLMFRNSYVDTFLPNNSKDINLVPALSIEQLHLKFGYLSFDSFKCTIPQLFPGVKYLNIECEDRDFQDQLKKSFPESSKRLICFNGMVKGGDF